MTLGTMRVLAERPEARVRLVCFPFAGGGASAFAGWSRQLPPWVEVAAVQLPGRERRREDPPCDRMEDLVPSLVDGLEDRLPERATVLFGHSMGALVAFEVCRELRTRGLPAPRGLIASGRGAPHVDHRVLDGAPPTRARIVELLGSYGGTPPAVLADDELLELYLPTLQADFTLVERYRHTPGPALDLSAAAYVGRDDPGVPVTDAAAWREHTTGPLRVRTFPGGHFYLQGCPELFTRLTEDLGCWFGCPEEDDRDHDLEHDRTRIGADPRARDRR